MHKVGVVYDAQMGTWNIMLGKECIYYSRDVLEVERWLEEREDRYIEE